MEWVELYNSNGEPQFRFERENNIGEWRQADTDESGQDVIGCHPLVYRLDGGEGVVHSYMKGTSSQPVQFSVKASLEGDDLISEFSEDAEVAAEAAGIDLDHDAEDEASVFYRLDEGWGLDNLESEADISEAEWIDDYREERNEIRGSLNQEPLDLQAPSYRAAAALLQDTYQLGAGHVAVSRADRQRLAEADSGEFAAADRAYGSADVLITVEDRATEIYNEDEDRGLLSSINPF